MQLFAVEQQDHQNLTNITGKNNEFDSFLRKGGNVLVIIICLFQRYHNGTLLNRTIFKYDEDLILRDLKPEQSGQYHCKATSLTGSIKSTSAVLTVFSKRKTILPVKRDMPL